MIEATETLTDEEQRRGLVLALVEGTGPTLRYIAEWSAAQYAGDPEAGLPEFVAILTAGAEAWPTDGAEPSAQLPYGQLLLAVAGFARRMAVDILAEGSTP